MEINIKSKSKLIILLFLFNNILAWSGDFLENITQSFSFNNGTFTSGSEIQCAIFNSTVAFNQNSFNFANEIKTEKLIKKFPFYFSGGNLSLAGVLSKLNNPEIDTSVDGFSSAYSDPGPITCSLASFSSFTNPISTFSQFGYKNENTFIKTAFVNGIFIPESRNWAWSGKIVFAPGDLWEIIGTGAISSYTLEENKSNSWYLSKPYFQTQDLCCFSLETSINFGIFWSNFSLFTYETYKNNFEKIYKTQIKIETENVRFSGTGFFNYSKNIISRDNTVLSPCTQFKINFQYKIPFIKQIYDEKDEVSHNYKYLNFLKLGFTAYGNFSATEKNHDLKAGFNTLLDFTISDLLFTGNISLKAHSTSPIPQIKYGSFSVVNNWDFINFSTLIKLSAQYYIGESFESTTQNYKITSESFLLDNNLTIQGCFSYSCKNHKIYNKKLKLGGNFTIKNKKLILILKINGDFCI